MPQKQRPPLTPIIILPPRKIQRFIKAKGITKSRWASNNNSHSSSNNLKLSTSKVVLNNNLVMIGISAQKESA